MKRVIATAVVLLCTATAGLSQQIISWDDAYSRADEIISRLTTGEKIKMTRGYNSFFFNGVPEKGIPYLYLSDATQGVHIRSFLADVKPLERSTAFPAPIMLAATFNPALSYEYAKAVGEECRAGGIEVLLGPGLNIYRQSQCGRNFEYFGEDPWLVSRMIEQYVKGIQSTGTAACLKHFVANNTEFYRRRSNSIVDERTLHEIYLPGFKAGIDAGVATVMTSYNLLNGEWTGESDFVINELLRKRLGFRGGVMADWGSVWDFEKVLRSGQNIEMPGNTDNFSPTLRELLAMGNVTVEEIEDMIRPILATGVAFGLYDREKYDPALLEKMPEHKAVAARVAEEGVVLLKNNGVLPLQGGRSILVAGKFLNEIPRGLGAAAVDGYDNITLADALRAKFGADVKFEATPTDEQIRNASAVIVSTGTIDEEFIDRPFALPSAEEGFVANAVKNNPNTIVLVNSGSGIRMTGWADAAAAVIYGWYPGQNGFSAIAGVISGDVNPSGKLPMTIEREFADSPGAGYLPEGKEPEPDRPVNDQLTPVYDVNYTETVLVGYRWYETKNIKPLFPFGHGLSYTTFSLTKPAQSAKTIAADKPVKISLTLANTGKQAGSEVVQLYVREKNPVVLRPVKELKGMSKVALEAGGEQTVEFEVSYADLAWWNPDIRDWNVTPGDFEILVGTSSADIKHTFPVTAIK